MNLCYLYELTREVRLGEEAALRPPVTRGEGPKPTCLKCGWGIEPSLHFGRVWYFDPGTEVIHKCREPYGVTMARIRRKAELDV